MQSKTRTRAIALLTGGVLTLSATVGTAPAQAADKEKTYKAGAVALGALGAYLVIKGKTLPGVLAGAGAYYAYKKGKDAKNDDRDYDDDFYSDADNDVYPDERYSDDNDNDYGYYGAAPSKNGNKTSRSSSRPSSRSSSRSSYVLK